MEIKNEKEAVHVPLVDLKAQYDSMKGEIDAAIRSVIEDTAFVGAGGNTHVRGFEEEFAQYLGAKHCVACGNGTDAIEIALEALGVGHGDEVIVPALTWISTAEAVTNRGATAVFADILPGRYTIDPSDVQKKITQKTRGIIAVHLYGLPAEMDELNALAKNHGLFTIEDCAQAHGAEYKGKKVGTIGTIATWSFFPSKNLGAYGDAGAITTEDSKLAEACKLITNHGQLKKNEHRRIGRNSRMDGIQAAILRAKLKHLAAWIDARRTIASAYRNHLAGKKGILAPTEPANSKHVYHLFAVLAEDRDRIHETLASAGIDSAVHYPKPLHLLPPYANSNAKCPIAERVASTTLSLPMYPELDLETVARICRHI